MNNYRLLVGLLVVLLGLSFLLELPLFRIAFSFIIIWVGYQIITGQKWQTPNIVPTTVNENSIKRVLIFSGIDQKITSSAFKNAEIIAIFGGGQLNLNEVKTASDSIELNIVAIFGGLKLIVPPSWNIDSEGVGIVGAFNNRTNPRSSKIKVIMKGVAIFGGVEVVTA